MHRKSLAGITGLVHRAVKRYHGHPEFLAGYVGQPRYVVGNLALCQQRAHFIADLVQYGLEVGHDQA